MARWRCLLFLLVFCRPPVPGEIPPSPARTASFRAAVSRPAPALELFRGLSSGFERNMGQADPEVEFLARSRGGTLFLTSTEAVLALPKSAGAEAGVKTPQTAAAIRWRLSGTGASARMEGEEQLACKSHYLLGEDPAAWRPNVPHYARVRMRDAVPGVDLVYRTGERGIEYDIVVRPGSDPSDLVIEFEGVRNLGIDAKGNLAGTAGEHEFVLRRPRIWQETGGKRRSVEGGYRTEAGRLRAGFRIGAYDRSRPLVIDPALEYSTYLGGSGNESGFGIAVDGEGNAYVAGITSSIDFPVRNPLQPPAGFPFLDAFVAKFDPTGTRLLYSTFLGGSGEDRAFGIALDPFGGVFVTGDTASFNFPVRSAYQRSFGGMRDAFVVRLSPSGDEIVYSTYLGGILGEEGYSIAVSSAGEAFVAGSTSSSDFPVRNALEPRFNGGPDDAFLAAFDPEGRISFSTYLGGAGGEIAYGVALDFFGSPYVTGITDSLNFPLRSALQPAFSGYTDAFITRFEPGGRALVYSTYFGGRNRDSGRAIAVDADGAAYVTGFTVSPEFPVRNAFQPLFAGVEDAFVSKIGPSGLDLLYSTYLGGAQEEEGLGIAVDAGGRACVAGFTGSLDFPVKEAVQPLFGGGNRDAFVAVLNEAGSGLVYSTYLGGTGEIESGYSVAIDPLRNVYVSGQTNSRNFPVRNALEPRLAGPADAFVSKLAPSSPLRTILFAHLPVGSEYVDSITLGNFGGDALTGTLIFTDAYGAPLQVEANSRGKNAAAVRGSFVPIRLAPGATGFFDILAAPPLPGPGSGWVRFETFGGIPSGAIYFQLLEGGIVKAAAGVLASVPVQSAVIPVDYDIASERLTGFAIANPGARSIAVRLSLLDENGNVVERFAPPELNPLAPHRQEVRFLQEYFPARPVFRGSAVLTAETEERFVAVALVEVQGLLTVVPALPGGADK